MRVEDRTGVPKGARGLFALVIALALLIAAGTGVVVVTIIHRALAPHRERVMAADMAAVRPVAPGMLAVPPGTRIGALAASGAGDWLALLLQGGGAPDRVVFVDPHEPGRTLGTLALAPGGAAAAPSPP